MTVTVTVRVAVDVTVAVIFTVDVFVYVSVRLVVTVAVTVAVTGSVAVHRVFPESNLVGLSFLYSVSYIKSIPTHEKLFAIGKSGPIATFNLLFLELGWPWVGEFVGFVLKFKCFPTQHKLVYRKHRYATVTVVVAVIVFVVVTVHVLSLHLPLHR